MSNSYYNEQRNGANNTTIPQRWLKCPRRGELIAGRFIPFKTPLDDKYSSKLNVCDLFTPQMFMSIVSSYKFKLGLWIDLTFSTRYYDKKIVEDKGITYVKCQCRGHDECPTEEQTKVFIEICDKFSATNPLDVIGVHCTHGFNRTGFLICAYLIEKLDWSVEAAFNTFAKSRPPGIYKPDYIQELFRRYNDGEDVPDAPPLPDWSNEFDDNDDHQLETNSNRNYKNSSKSKSFMEGITGVLSVSSPNKCHAIEQKCQTMCNFKGKGFPGAQPVSLDNNNIIYLHNKEYMVSWKADGTRYMMLINGKNEIYFIDRDSAVFQVEGITFPKRKQPQNHLENTLLDGEMIIDIVNGNKVPRYLIYDIITFESINVGGTDFRTRLLCIDREIIGPREKAKEEKLIDRTSEPFGIRKKDFWELHDTYKIFGEKFKRNLTHEIDGLIVEPVADPYMGGRCDAVLKWKPPSHNSIDFKLKVCRDDIGRLVGQLFVGGHTPPLATMKITKDLKVYDNKIIECTYDMSTNQWKFMRERTDKSFPNSYDTAIAVFNSIRFPITKEVLLEFIQSRGWRKQFDSRNDRSLMPPPCKVPRKS